MPLTCDLTFPFLSQRPCVAEPEATSLSSAEPRALRSLTGPFCSSFSSAEVHAAASNLSSSTATGPDKVTYPMLKHLPRSGMIFFFTSSIFPGLHIPFLPSGRHLLLFPPTRRESLSTLLLPSGLSLSPTAYQTCLNASFYLVFLESNWRVDLWYRIWKLQKVEHSFSKLFVWHFSRESVRNRVKRWSESLI